MALAMTAPRDDTAVLRRVNQLVNSWRYRSADRELIRDICAGGDRGLRAILGRQMTGMDHHSVPAANMILSGLTRIGQKIGRPPDLRVDMPPAADGSESARKKAERVRRIVADYDRADWLPEKLAQVGLWLPGYGFATLVVTDGQTADGHYYPRVEARDPYHTFPGDFGTDTQPEDCAWMWQWSMADLRQWCLAHERTDVLQKVGMMSGGGVVLDPAEYPTAGSGGSILGVPGAGYGSVGGTGVRVAEYRDRDATWLLLPDSRIVLARWPNPITQPTFVVLRRHVLGELIGQYDHAIGLQGAMIKANQLALIALTDATFSEALALDTPIPTPTGWVQMGAIEPGDEILGADGLPVEVVSATEVQHDRDCYRVTFADGTSMVASDGHLWQARMRTLGGRVRDRVYTTREMVESGRTFSVPTPRPWKFPEVDLPIDPYVLGLWLGNGAASSPKITSHSDDHTFVGEQLVAAGYTVRQVKQNDRAPTWYVATPDSRKGRHGSGFIGQLKAAGLYGNKHIPAAYLRASIDQRHALLQGLMDTDGCISKPGYCSWTTVDEFLCGQMMELLRSLGQTPVAAWRADGKFASGGYWMVTFTARHGLNPCRLPRKADRVRFFKHGDWVRIRSIEPVESVPVRCIAVASSDHLFLAGIGGHVTHNTNVFGDLMSGRYARGRFATNVFREGGKVDVVRRDVPYQYFAEIARMEQQFRTTVGYPVTDDAVSPAAQATGQGIDRLNSVYDLEIMSYFGIIDRGLELLDAIRLEWDETCYPDVRKPLVGTREGQPYAEHYTPRLHIKGWHRTRRTHGAMAGLSDSAKMVALLQLKGAGIIDADTVRDQMTDLGDTQAIKEAVDGEAAKNALMGAMTQGVPLDPRVAMTLIEMLPESKTKTALRRFWTPEEPQMSPEQEAMAAPPAAAPQMAGPPVDAATMLARLTASGAQGGVQLQGAI